MTKPKKWPSPYTIGVLGPAPWHDGPGEEHALLTIEPKILHVAKIEILRLLRDRENLMGRPVDPETRTRLWAEVRAEWDWKRAPFTMTETLAGFRWATCTIARIAVVLAGELDDNRAEHLCKQNRVKCGVRVRHPGNSLTGEWPILDPAEVVAKRWAVADSPGCQLCVPSDGVVKWKRRATSLIEWVADREQWQPDAEDEAAWSAVAGSLESARSASQHSKPAAAQPAPTHDPSPTTPKFLPAEETTRD
ncbi:hypothetical protein [Nocardioides sp. HB32]